MHLWRRAPAFCSAFHKHGHTHRLYLNMGWLINSLSRRRAYAFEKSALDFPYDGQIASLTLLINNQTFASPNRFRARSLTFSLLWVVAMHDSTDSTGDGWLETIYLQCLKNGIEFVVGSRPCSEGFFRVLRFPSRHKTQKFGIPIRPRNIGWKSNPVESIKIPCNNFGQKCDL